MQNFYKLFNYFPQNKKSFIVYSVLSFVVGLLELFGVALTYPFVLKLLSAGTYKGVSPLALGIAIIVLFLVKNFIMILYSYLQARFSKNFDAEINLKILSYYLTAPYIVTSKISFASKANILGFIVPNVVDNFVLRLLNLNVNFFIFGLICCFLVVKFPLATVITVFCAFLIILFQNLFFKPALKKVSSGFSKSSEEYNQRRNEALINLKGVKISNNEKFFFENYKSALCKYFENCTNALFLNMIPPYITEPFVIILLFILLAVISVQLSSEPDKLIASYAVIVSAIFRLAPTISRIQVNLNGINTVRPLLDEFFDICEEYKLNVQNQVQYKEFTGFENSIQLKNVDFCYNDNAKALSDVSFEIKKGSFTAIVGLSGAGKTTLIDVIAGLLQPQNGEILVDGKPLTSPLKIGYIPQEFTIISGSILENITFGSPVSDIPKAIDALKKAQLYDFVFNNFENNIYANPFVDTAGFSQGQKQRLIIARALYSEPDILILDEATSALDLKTEDEICNVLNSLKNSMTIIAIAHRLSAVKAADKIIFMKDAKISSEGTFEELYSNNPDFSELIKLSKIKEL